MAETENLILTVAGLERILKEIHAEHMEKRKLMNYAIPHINALMALGYKCAAIRGAFTRAKVIFTESTFSNEISKARSRFNQRRDAGEEMYDLLWLHEQVQAKGQTGSFAAGGKNDAGSEGAGSTPKNRYEYLKGRMSTAGGASN